MDSWFGKDKLKHFSACFFSAIIDPRLAIGLAIGKEVGDKYAKGNHWCWKDLAADGVGIIFGTLIWWFFIPKLPF